MDTEEEMKIKLGSPPKMSVSKKSHYFLSQMLSSSSPQSFAAFQYFLWNCWSTQAIKVHGGRRDAADEARAGRTEASASLTLLSPEPS